MAITNSPNWDNFKFQTANEVKVNLKQGYNGDLTARDAGRIGGNIVRKLISYAEGNMPGVK
jgi:hypothetical protein